MLESKKRDRNRPIKVYVTDQERKEICKRANDVRLTASTFLRQVALGYTPECTFDQDAIKQLIKLHADQGRLGGLLKLCLSKPAGEAGNRAQLRTILKAIENLQELLVEWVMGEKKR